MKKQTAVEFLENQYTCNGKLTAIDFYQAKEMQKEQIVDAFQDSRILSITNNCSSGEQYYNETYTNA